MYYFLYFRITVIFVTYNCMFYYLNIFMLPNAMKTSRIQSVYKIIRKQICVLNYLIMPRLTKVVNGI